MVSVSAVWVAVVTSSVSVTGISVSVSVSWVSVSIWGIGTIEYSWVSISRSLATVSSISISISVVWVSITVASISKTISIRAIVSFGGCFGFWFSNNGCDEAQGEYGKFHHFEYELFETLTKMSLAIEFV